MWRRHPQVQGPTGAERHGQAGRDTDKGYQAAPSRTPNSRPAPVTGKPAVIRILDRRSHGPAGQQHHDPAGDDVAEVLGTDTE